MEIHTNGINSRRNSSSINVFHNATSTKFPPLSEDFAFQRDVQVLTHIQQYTVAYIY